VVRTSQGNYKNTETRSTYSPQRSTRQRSNSYGMPAQRQSAPTRTRQSKPSSGYSTPTRSRSGSSGRSSGGTRSTTPTRGRR
jgi:hypothetical protein